MSSKHRYLLLPVLCSVFFILSCKKDKKHPDYAAIKTIVYAVKGTNFTLNYIDSNSVFRSNMMYSDSFRYEFKKGSGANIGISIFLQSPSDTIFSWSIYIDGKLYADAFSEGGAYLSVPYNY